MKCPDCGKEMEKSNIVIDMLPETRHYYCGKCDAIWDESEGEISECFTSQRIRKKKDNAHS